MPLYQRFMVNRFREILPYEEVPIKLILRGKSARDPLPDGVSEAEPVRPSVKAQRTRAKQKVARAASRSAAKRAKRPGSAARKPTQKRS